MADIRLQSWAEILAAFDAVFEREVLNPPRGAALTPEQVKERMERMGYPFVHVDVRGDMYHILTIDDRDEHIEVRRRGVESIAYLGADEVHDIIAAAYESAEESMRISAIFAMGRSADTVWSDTVQAELLSNSPAMRYEAARACGELEIRQAVSALGRLILDPDPEVQVAAIGALGQIGGKRARRLLERCLRDRNEVLREAAEHALAELMLGEGSLDLFIFGSPSGRDDDSGIDGLSE